jgi:hypothetical protein
MWRHLALHAHGMRAPGHAAIIALALPVLPGRKRRRGKEVAGREPYRPISERE